MPRTLRRLAELSPGEWLLLGQLLGGALAVAAGLRLVSLPRLTGVLTRCAGHRALRRFPWDHRRHPVARLSVLADLAARAMPGQGRCLMRSLLLFWLLRLRGEPVALFLGVRKAADDPVIRGHAWVETGGRVRGESPATTGAFTPVLRL